MDVILFRNRTNKSVYLFIVAGVVASLLALGLFVFSVFYIFDRQIARLNVAGEDEVEIPVLNKDGLNYFISRQEQRGKTVAPPPITASPSPKVR